MITRQRLIRGFTLLEVLIALFILLVGLLGLAALMTKGQRASFEAYQRQQALAMAQEMTEKIRANQGRAQDYVTGTTESGSMPGNGGLLAGLNNCSSNCSGSAIAQNDLATWDGMLVGAAETKDAAANRVGGIIGARGCIERPGGSPEQPVFWVSVAWQGAEATVAPPADASACGAGLYGTETRRRLVTLSVATCPLDAVLGGCL